MDLTKLPDGDLDELRALSRDTEAGYKLGIAIFEGSSLRRQLEVLEHYSVEVEFCAP